MKKNIINIGLVFLILLFSYSAIQCFKPIVAFDFNQDNLNIKLSKICSDIFDKKFSIVVSSYDQINNNEIIINFRNSLEKNSYGNVTLSKTVLSKYQLIKINYSDTNNQSHVYTASKSYSTLIVTSTVSLVLLLLLINYNKYEIKGLLVALLFRRKKHD